MKNNFFEEIANDLDISVSKIINEQITEQQWKKIVKHGVPAWIEARRNNYSGFVIKGKFYYRGNNGLVTSVKLDSIKGTIHYSDDVPMVESGILSALSAKVKPAAVNGAINMYRNIVNRKEDTGKKPLIIAAQSFNIDPRVLKKELEKRGFLMESSVLNENYRVDFQEVNHSEQPVIAIDPTGNFSQKVRELKVKARKLGFDVQIDNARKLAYINDATLPEKKKLVFLRKAANQANKSLLNKDHIKKSKPATDNIGKSIEDNTQLYNLYKENRDKAIEFSKSLSKVSNAMSSNVIDNNTSQRINARVQQYLAKFTGELSQPEFIEELKRFVRASLRWKIDGRNFNYSESNLVLIMAQINDDSVSSFGAVDYWKGRGYQPKNPEKDFIMIIVPKVRFSGRTEGLNAFINSTPESIPVLKSFLKTYNGSRKEGEPLYSMNDLMSNGKVSVPDDIAYRVDHYFSHTPLYNERGTSGQFKAIKIFAENQVEPIEGKQQSDNEVDDLLTIDDNIEDNELLELLLTATINMIKNSDIELSVEQKKNMAVSNAAGISMGGKIQVVDTMEGVSKLRVMIHEFAHEILHHRYNSKLKGPSLADGKTHRKEIEADSVAAMVLDMYGFPSKKSKMYVSLNAMKQTNPDKVSDLVKEHLKSIRETTFWIMRELNKEIKDLKNEK